MANQQNEKQLIAQLKKKYNLSKSEDILSLYSMLQEGRYEFHTPEGRQFDDEIYELAMKAKKKPQEKQVQSKPRFQKTHLF